MAQSTEKQSWKIWKAVVVGAAVPVMMLTGASAASAAGAVDATEVNAAQLPAPGLPAPDPSDPTAGGDDLVTQLSVCVAALVTAVADATGDMPDPAPAPAEQAPPDAPDAPDATDLTSCTELIAALGQPAEPPSDLPVPKEQ
jgi:hypothetical protein